MAAAPDDEPRAVGLALARRSPRRARRCASLISGPMNDVRIGRVADRHDWQPFGRELDAVLEVLARDEQAARQDAALAGVEADERRCQRHDPLEVGVVEHDGRRLAAELEHHALDRARGRRHHALARSRSSR